MKKETNIKDDPNKGERIFLQGKKISSKPSQV